MADVNTQEIFDLKTQMFGIGTGGTVVTSFTNTFFAGCRYVCNIIRARASGTSVTTPTDLATDFTGLDQDIFYAAVSSGLDYFISKNGVWQNTPDGDLRAAWERDLKDCVGQYQRDTTALKGRLGTLT